MSRNSKFSAEDKLRIINEMKNIDVGMVAKKYEISRINTIPRSSKPIWSNNIKHRIIR